jgi:predicted nucleotidyltransferase
MKIVQMYHGSHLYGTNTPESDVDFKGVALAETYDVLLGRIPKVIESKSPRKGDGEKNQAGDVDLQVFSLHQFMHLALKGETVAVDMLHAPQSKCQIWTDIWEELRRNRHLFYTRSMKSLVGYARSQAAKYGLRGSRLAAAKASADVLRANTGNRLAKFWEELPIGEHARYHRATPRTNGMRMYEV